MSMRQFSETLLAREEIVAPPVARACQEQSFELPTGLYVASGLLFLGFVSVLSLAFANPGMAVPFGIIVAFLAAFFAVPAIFVRVGGRQRNGASSLRWSDFTESGVATEHGRCSGRDATILVLLLPALIFCFGLAVTAIAAIG